MTSSNTMHCCFISYPKACALVIGNVQKYITVSGHTYFGWNAYLIYQSEVKPLKVDIWLKQPLDIAGIKLRMEAHVYFNLLNTSAHAFGYEMKQQCIVFKHFTPF
jgi:hypothetical protein